MKTQSKKSASRTIKTSAKKLTTKQKAEQPSVAEKWLAAKRKCRHCGEISCQRHCPATKTGHHQVEHGDMQVEESGPALVVVEIFCGRCANSATAVVGEESFEWNGW